MKEKKGIQAENFFASRLYQLGIQSEYINEWFDYYIPQFDIHVEVKSTLVTINSARGGKANKRWKTNNTHRPGRFRINPDNHKKLCDANGYYAFIVSAHGEFLIAGIAKAKDVPNQSHISLGSLRNFKKLSLTDWISKLRNQ